MRYIMKGGVWKNSQDQILKAAIMKYGLNQWSRISSLLQRKSAKQCKQRWYEWLDPSIKKTQWSRAQDQKLLQLARVFPSQWRTIAPFVGRTPTQCFERYQKLLDLAQGKVGQETQDLKRLRPRQIDPNPQTKPARPDPIDMDEDQKEMLAQVRVRLANTKGKKAKRKQREKIIEQARRLAQLQKIRELQMAGVDNIPTAKQIKRMRQKQDIDYNKQIPFKRDAPQFIYKVEATETSRNAFFASTISLQTLEGKRRDVEQQLQRKLDKKRIKRLKDTDYKAMLAIKNRFQKPVSTPIQLPQPHLTEKDLEDMKKYNITTPLNSVVKNTPFGMTPENKIMLAARVNFSLNHRDMMTPVAENIGEQELDGVQGLNYLKELQRKQRESSNLKSTDRLISERVKTPTVHEWQQGQSKVRSLFKNLRKPENLIEFEIPEEQQQEDQGKEEDERMMDAQQMEKLEEINIQKIMEEKLNQRSSALKLNLERVKNIPNKLFPESSQQIDRLIENQMLNMIYTDAVDYPIEVFSLPDDHKLQYLPPLPLQKRRIAQNLIQLEKGKMGSFEEGEYLEAREKAYRYLETDMKKKEVRKREEKLDDAQWENMKYWKQLIKISQYNQNEVINQELQKKTKRYLGGYEKLIGSKIKEINTLQKQLENLKMKSAALEVLEQHESISALRRLQKEEKFYKIIYESI